MATLSDLLSGISTDGSKLSDLLKSLDQTQISDLLKNPDYYKEGGGFGGFGYGQGAQAGAEGDYLSRFGYTGPIGINPYERMGLDFISEMYGGRAPFQTMYPAQEFLTELTGGEYGPTGQKFREEVYGATEGRAMELLDKMQKGIAEKFTHGLGSGFFGGKHALAQSELARGFGSDLAQTLAELNLTGYESDIANRISGATGLTTLGTAQQGVANQILNNIMGGGEMLTSRELTNRAEYQNALERAYNDWARARQESLMPFSMALSLLGQQAELPIVNQTQPFGWGNFLGGLAGAGGSMGSAAIGNK